MAINYLDTAVDLTKAYRSGGPGALLQPAATVAGQQLGIPNSLVQGGLSLAQGGLGSLGQTASSLAQSGLGMLGQMAGGFKPGKSVFGGTSPAQAAMSGFTGRGATPFTQLVGGGLAKTGLGQVGMGRGTRPKALHTEYAKTTAEWEKPYGAGTEIVFYLQRADSAGGGGGSSAFSKETNILTSTNDALRGFDWDGNYGFMSESGYAASTYESWALGSAHGAVWENNTAIPGDYFSGTDWQPISQLQQ